MAEGEGIVQEGGHQVFRDVATQDELNTHKGSGDHDTHNDARYDATGAAASAVGTHAGSATAHGGVDPSSHKSRHAAGGADALAAADLPSHASRHVTGGADAVAVAHADTTGKTENDHHNKDHASRHVSGGGDDFSALEITVKDLKVAGLTGATAILPRLVGGTNSGPPTSGTFGVGDYVVDATGQMYVCTVAGSPGTWVAPGSGQYLAGPATLTSAFDVLAVGTTATDVTGLSLSVPATSRPFMLHLWAPISSSTGTAAAAAICKINCIITDNSGTAKQTGSFTAIQVTAANVQWLGFIDIWVPMLATDGNATYKVQAKLAANAPANWSAAKILPSAAQPAIFEAVSR